MAYRPHPLGCRGCPADSKGRSFVPGTGNPNAAIALIGQGPGKVEAALGIPFSGPSGGQLEEWLYEAGLNRSDLWVTNTVLCWLPNDAPPTAAEKAHCWQAHVGHEIARLTSLQVIVPVGTAAAQSFIRNYNESMAGTRARVEIDLPEESNAHQEGCPF